MMAQVHPHLPTILTNSATDAFHESPQVFTVWKKALFFGGTGFTVFDSSGDLLFQVETYSPSQVLLMDAHGSPLLTLRRKFMSLQTKWEGFISHGRKSEERIFGLKKSSSLSRRASGHGFKVSHPFRNLYRVEGSFRERCCSIYSCSKSLVAEVKRKRARSEMLLEKDVFSVVVHPGSDPALIVSWIVILDHMKRDNLRLLTQAALRCLGLWETK